MLKPDPDQKGSLAFAFGILFTGVLVLALCAYSIASTWTQNAWPDVQATITEVEPWRSESSFGNDERCAYLVHYAFEIDGRTYDGRGGFGDPADYGLQSVTPDCVGLETVKRAALEKGTVRVWYDPADPSDSTTALHNTFWAWLWVCPGSFLLLLGIVAVLTPANWR